MQTETNVTSPVPSRPESMGPLPITFIWIGTFILWPLWLAGLIIGGMRAGSSRTTTTWGNFWLHVGLSVVASVFFYGLMIAAGGSEF